MKVPSKTLWGLIPIMFLLILVACPTKNYVIEAEVIVEPSDGYTYTWLPPGQGGKTEYPAAHVEWKEAKKIADSEKESKEWIVYFPNYERPAEIKNLSRPIRGKLALRYSADDSQGELTPPVARVVSWDFTPE